MDDFITLEVNGQDVEVGRAFLDLSPQEQERTVEEIAATLGGSPSQPLPLVTRANTSLVDGIGGVIDAINPFDQPHALNPFPGGTGSATTGLRNAFGAAGVQFNEPGLPPQNAAEAFADGVGGAASFAIPAAGAARAVGALPGAVGSVGSSVAQSLSSTGGIAAELVAGGTAETARSLAEEAGASQPIQDIAAIAGGIGPGLAGAAARTGANLSPTRRAISAVQTNLAPFTNSGGREIARQRLQSLAGGEDRAAELAARIGADNPLGLSPAQQTGDPNIIGLENLTGRLDANFRADTDAGRVRSQAIAREEIGRLGGNPEDAAAFVQQRRTEFAEDLKNRISRARETAVEQLRDIGPQRTEIDNSLILRTQLDDALDSALADEGRLWAAVDRSIEVPPINTKQAVQSFVDDIPQAQRNDIPRVARDVLDNADVYGNTATVNDLHGLYSELRRIARSAKAGTDQNNNLARISNGVADAILKDFEGTSAGRAIDEARTFSAELHDKFDKGAVGRLLKQSLAGDTAIEPELSLARTINRGGTAAATDAQNFARATDGATNDPVQDQVRRLFSNSAIDPTTGFDARKARRFIRDNAALLKQFPELRTDIDSAVNSQLNADQTGEFLANRLASLQDQRSLGQAVIDGRTVEAVLSATNPRTAARQIANEARKDTSGLALEGVKGAFTRNLISKAFGVRAGEETFSGDSVLASLNDPKQASALREIFDKGELGRLRLIASEASKLRVQGADVGASLSDARPSRFLDSILRVVAVRNNPFATGGIESFQINQIASNRVSDALQSLTADKASLLIADAVQDPTLLRSLLTDMRKITPGEFDKKVLPRLFPYLVGGVSATGGEGEP